MWKSDVCGLVCEVWCRVCRVGCGVDCGVWCRLWGVVCEEKQKCVPLHEIGRLYRYSLHVTSFHLILIINHIIELLLDS